MGWEMRGNYGPYYYTARKVDGRTVRQYWGQGDAGTIGHSCDGLARHAANMEDAELFAAKETWAAADSAVKSLCVSRWASAQELLHGAGYHRPNRGPWRKKRMSTAKQKRIEPAGCSPVSAEQANALVPTEEAQRLQLIVAAAGNDALLPEEEAVALACLKVCRGERGLAKITPALENVLRLTTRNSVQQHIRAFEVEAQVRELSGPNPAALEMLLVERVVACSLLVNFYEMNDCGYVKARDKAAGSSWANPNQPDRHGEMLQKRLDGAHKRLMAALKTLAQVRRLAVPVSVQVNVAANGGQQVNVGSVSTS